MLNTYKHTLYKLSINTIFLNMVGLANDPEITLFPYDELGPITQKYITETLNIKSYAQLFYKIATINDAGRSCIEEFMESTKDRLQKDYGMTEGMAQVQSNALARLFVNGVSIGMRMRVVWNEDGKCTCVFLGQPCTKTIKHWDG